VKRTVPTYRLLEWGVYARLKACQNTKAQEIAKIVASYFPFRWTIGLRGGSDRRGDGRVSHSAAQLDHAFCG
jgi:hypothetical protein